jgi:hypothetical protein
MNDYTPTTEKVRHDYPRDYTKSIQAEFAEFDRWLAKVKAEAWAEGWRVGRNGLGVNPYRSI